MDDFHFGTEVVGANDAGWATDNNNLHGGYQQLFGILKLEVVLFHTSY